MFSSLHKLIRARKKVKWHWLPLLTAWYLFLVILKNWWAMTTPEKSLEEYNIIYFLVYGHLMIILYLLVSVVLPDKIPSKGMDLKKYYFKHHRYLWSLMAAVGVVSILISSAYQVLGHEPLNWPNIIAFFVFLSITMLLIISKKYWLHAMVLCLFTLITILEITQSIT